MSTSAMGDTNWFSNNEYIDIPDTGSSGVADPYASTISVSGVTGVITSLKVTLFDVFHTYPDDIDILLVGPQGQNVILMSDAGGGSNIYWLDLTFMDGAPSLPDSTMLTSGTYSPTNYGSGDTFPSPAPDGPYGSALSVFNGTDANGTWSLFVIDDANYDDGKIKHGWKLTIETQAVPAPGAALLALIGLPTVSWVKRRFA